jgi:hypothetical protein
MVRYAGKNDAGQSGHAPVSGKASDGSIQQAPEWIGLGVYAPVTVIEIQLIIPILEKGPLTPIAPLRYMMRDPRQDKTREAGHAISL